MMINIEITPMLVYDFWRHMLEHYHLETKKKSTSTLMKCVRPFTGISEEKWKSFSTLIGDTLYTDITPGIESPELSLLGQMLVIPHECQHRIQNDRDFLYPPKYLLSKGYRCVTEINGYTCNQELLYALTGRLIPITRIIEKLENYRLDKKQLMFAKKVIAIRTMQIGSGKELMHAVKRAKGYLLQYAIEPEKYKTKREVFVDISDKPIDFDRLLQ